MSKSRKPAARKPPDELSKENAKLTRDIAELEDALHLHQRFLHEDRNSVPGLIRQEVGGARWQYGGGGKLHTFRSKSDLEETEGKSGRRNTARTRSKSAALSKKTEDRPPLEVVSTKPPGPRCLNEDVVAATESQQGRKGGGGGDPPRKASARPGTTTSRSKSAHYQQAAWNTGPKTLQPDSKEYDAFMHRIFGEGGFPLRKEYAVESAAVGMSLFAEKDHTDISEMKNKVLKRASAVLIMRPRSATSAAAQTKSSVQQKSTAAPRNQKMTKAKAQIKRGGATMSDVKSVIAVESGKDFPKGLESANRNLSNKTGSGGKSPSDSQSRYVPDKWGADSKGDSAENAKETEKENELDAEPKEECETDGQEVSEDIGEVVSLVNKAPATKTSPLKNIPLPDHRYVMPKSNWDKNAVPKPWDSWVKSASDVRPGKRVSSEPTLDKSGSNSKKPSLKRSNSLRVQVLSNIYKDSSGEKPHMGKSWTSSSHTSSLNQTKQAQPSRQLAHRHSWTGGYAPRPTKPPSHSDNKEAKPLTPSGSLELSKQRDIVDWLDKHMALSQDTVAPSQEESSPGKSNSESSSSSSTGDDILGTNLPSCISLDREGFHDSKVAAWLSSLGLKETKWYQKIFSQHQIEVVDLPSLTVPVLQHMGVCKVGALIKVMRGVDRLRRHQAKAARKAAKVKAKDSVGGVFFNADDHFPKTQVENHLGDADFSTDRKSSESNGHFRGDTYFGSDDPKSPKAKTKGDVGHMYFNTAEDSEEAYYIVDEGKGNGTDYPMCETGELYFTNLNSQTMNRSMNGARPEEKRASSASARAESFRSSLQEMYRDLSVKNPADPKTERTESLASRETCPFELSNFPQEGFSDSSSFVLPDKSRNNPALVKTGGRKSLKVDAVSSTGNRSPASLSRTETGKSASPSGQPLRNVRRNVLSSTDVSPSVLSEKAGSEGAPNKRSVKASSSKAGSPVTKVKDRLASGRVKGHGDSSSPQRQSSFKTDADVQRLAQRLVERQKKRKQEEDLLDQRLQRMRDQRRTLAARHRARERSQSVEREGVTGDALDGAVRRERRRSDSGLGDGLALDFDNVGELIVDHYDSFASRRLPAKPAQSTDLSALQLQDTSQMDKAEGGGKQLQEFTLKKVRKLQNKLNHLEQSLLLSSPSLTHTQSNTTTTTTTTTTSTTTSESATQLGEVPPGATSSDEVIIPFSEQPHDDEEEGEDEDQVVLYGRRIFDVVVRTSGEDDDEQTSLEPSDVIKGRESRNNRSSPRFRRSQRKYGEAEGESLRVRSTTPSQRMEGKLRRLLASPPTTKASPPGKAVERESGRNNSKKHVPLDFNDNSASANLKTSLQGVSVATTESYKTKDVPLDFNDNNPSDGISQLNNWAGNESNNNNNNTTHHTPLDFKENATVTPPVPNRSEKDSVVPKVITLTFKDAMLGKGGGGEIGGNSNNNAVKEDGGEVMEGKAGVGVGAVPHLSMSKRQLLNEIRREKDEHRKNVRHLKSELTRLQHKDPVKRSEIDHADIDFQESDLIGEGSMCRVFHGQYQGADVAVKRLKTPLSSQDKNYFAAEVSLLRDLHHPRVVLLVGVSTTGPLPLMVLEYMAGRDLHSLIHDPSREVLEPPLLQQLARDVSSGMVYLHHHRPPVLHLDLTSLNILLTANLRAKIADFGFSKLKHDADKKAGKSSSSPHSTKNQKVRGSRSPAWMAPELLRGGEVTPKADVFSFGVILWEMASRKHPYDGCSVYEILERVRTDRRPEIPEWCPPDLSALITKCWSHNPAARPNFKDVLKQVEELSFPDAARALSQVAGVPQEAQDVSSTRLESALPIPDKYPGQSSTSSRHHYHPKNPLQQKSRRRERVNEMATVKKEEWGHSGEKVSPDSYDADSLSEEETLHLDDSLNTTPHNDSLEEISVRSSSSHMFNCAGDSRATRTKDVSGSVRMPQNTAAKVSDVVPLLPLECLRSPSPQAVHLSVSSLFDSMDDDQFPGSCAEMFAKSKSPGRLLTPIVPRLALGEEEEEAGKPEELAPSKDPSPRPPLSTHLPLAPIQPQVKFETSVASVKESQSSCPASFRLSREESGDKKRSHPTSARQAVEDSGDKKTSRPSSARQALEESSDFMRSSRPMSARQARRLGMSRRSSLTDVNPHTPSSSSQELVPEALRKDRELNVEAKQDAGKTGAEEQTQEERCVSSPGAWTSQEEGGVSSPSTEAIERKSARYRNTPTPKERKSRRLLDNLQQPESSEPRMDSEIHQSTSSRKGTDAESETHASSSQSLSQNSVCSAPSRSHTLYQDASPVVNSDSLTLSDPNLPTTLLLPPPPPPPQPLLFTPSGPCFSKTKPSGEEEEGKTEHQQRQTMASVHQELLDISRQQPQMATSTTAALENNKKREFLKDRFHGNPHISVEVSALVERKGQLRETTVPHPSQLREAPVVGSVRNSMAGLLRKAMEDRRFAIGGNVAASASSQDTTEASWSVVDD